MLNFSICHGDAKLDTHFKTAPDNAKYISKDIRNEIIKCAGDIILEHIVSEVKMAKYYSIIADEAHDLSNKELMSVVLRYLDPQLEAFLTGIILTSERFSFLRT